METIICDLCGCSTLKPVYTVADTNYGSPGIYHLVQCDQCNLVFLNPRPNSNQIKKFYPTDAYHPFQAIKEEQQAQPNETHLERAKILNSLSPPSKTILDVGCGNGLFLTTMKGFGWHTKGVEPNKRAAAFSRERLALDVQTGDIFTLDTSTTYSVITFWDVLEHTHSPTKVLNHAYQLMSENGYLALNVPNWASWERQLFREDWIAIDAPRHLFHFTPTTLKALLNACGFKIKMVQTKAPIMSPASNLLRMGGRLVSPKKKSINEPAMIHPENSASEISPRKRAVIRLAYGTMAIPNALANLAGHGGTLTIVATKNPLT